MSVRRDGPFPQPVAHVDTRVPHSAFDPQEDRTRPVHTPPAYGGKRAPHLACELVFGEQRTAHVLERRVRVRSCRIDDLRGQRLEQQTPLGNRQPAKRPHNDGGIERLAGVRLSLTQKLAKIF